MERLASCRGLVAISARLLRRVVERWRRRTRYCCGTVLIAGVVSGVVIAITGVGLGAARPTGQAFVMLGVLAPALVVQDFWRFAAFSRDCAHLAVVNDGAWALVQA